MLVPVAMPAGGGVGGGKGIAWKRGGGRGVATISLTVISRLVLGSFISPEILQICQHASLIKVHAHQQHTTSERDGGGRGEAGGER